MKILRNDDKGVKCEMTAIGFIPCDDLATLDALIHATNCAYSVNPEIWEAVREANRVLRALADKISPSNPFD